MLALERHGSDVIVLFCDTGNEHAFVYEHLDYLEHKLGIKIHRLKSDFTKQIENKRKFIANDQRTGRRKNKRVRWTPKRKRIALLDGLQASGNPMLDLCQWKGRFPSRKAQFCTEHLKVNIARQFQAAINEEHVVVSWQGVRRDESLHRRDAMIFESITPRFHIYRPIVDMTKPEVFKYVKSRGLKHNPLYDLGFGRVGCMPCINATKNEIRLMAKHFPEEVKRIEAWEELVGNSSKMGMGTFFPPRERGLNNYDAYNQFKVASTIIWSKTARGGRQFPMFEEPSEECVLAGGACE